MEGPLSKWTNLVNGWQYRWFVLDSKNGFLIYYTSRDKMKRGSCRGVIHLKNAMIGIDDEDDSGFSITSDTKQFHFQARDILEREKWVKALEYAICLQRSKDESKSENDKSGYVNQEDNVGENNTFTLQQNEKFDAKIAEADAYLQILIAQVKKLESKIEAMNEDDEIYKKYVEIKISTHALIDSVKHSIVILQITRNALYPTCGIYHSSLPPLILGSPSNETIQHEKKMSCKEELLSNNAPISLALSASIPSIESDDRSKSLSLSSLRNTPPSSIWSSTEVVMPSSIINNNGNNGINHTQSYGKENTPLNVEDTLLLKNQNIQRSRSLSFSDTEDSLHFYDALNISSNNNHPIINQSNEQSSDLICDTTEITEKSPLKNVLLDTEIIKSHEINPTIEKSKSENAIFDENCLFELSKSDLELSEDLSQYGSMIKHLLSQVRIGMDLTKVTLPTFILERRSLLEMFADFFAHASTFCGIVEYKTARERMTQVVKYYLSSFHSGRQSVAKKPFNPILGEVFMCHWKSSVQNGSKTINILDSNQDCNLSFVAEQVSHHPPISAFYAENTEKRICINGNIWTKSKFLGLSIGVHMVGQAYIKLLDFDEEYVCTFPNAYARSIFSVPWMELGGKVTITCSKTGYFADIEFLTKPFYGGTKHQFIGQIFGPFDKSPYLTITGAWNGIMQAKTNKGDTFEFVNTETLEQQTKVVEPISQQKDYESRKIWLNVAKHLKAHELELATQEKRNIEEKQRLNARHRSVSGLKWECKFFEEVNGYWMYKNALTKQKSQPN